MYNGKAQAVSYYLFGFFVLFVFALMAMRLPLEITVISLLAGIVFLFAFIKTDFALIILIMSMLLSPEFKAGGVSDRAILIRGEDIFIIVIFLGWLARMAMKKELGLLKWTPLNKPIVMYMLVCVVSSLLGILWGDTDPVRAFFYLLKYFEYYFLFFLVVNTVKDERQVKMYTGFILLTAFIVCLIGWFQIPSGQRLSAPFESEGGEPNTFAGYLLLIIGLLIGFLLYPGIGSRFIYSILMVIMILPFIFTLSRGGWISFFPMLLTFIVFCKRYRFQLILASLIMLLVLPLVLPRQVFTRINETFAPEQRIEVMGAQYTLSESAAARVDTWRVGFNRWLQNPILGNGVPTGSVIDNQYVRVIAETGIVGIFCFLWILIRIFKLCLREYRDNPDNIFTRGLTLGFLGGFVGLLFHSMSSATFILIRIMEPFWFLMALIVSLPILQESSGKERMNGA